MNDDNTRQRLRYRSWHRGTREMDLLMGSFADAHLGVFNLAQLAQYEAIIEQGDPDLYNWVTGAESLPVEHDTEVMRLLCTHRYAQKSG